MLTLPPPHPIVESMEITLKVECPCSNSNTLFILQSVCAFADLLNTLEPRPALSFKCYENPKLLESLLGLCTPPGNTQLTYSGLLTFSTERIGETSIEQVLLQPDTLIAEDGAAVSLTLLERFKVCTASAKDKDKVLKEVLESASNRAMGLEQEEQSDSSDSEEDNSSSENSSYSYYSYSSENPDDYK